MSVETSIEWTESTWNPATGCTPVSAGCEHCYAERLAKRLQAMGNPNYRQGFTVTVHPHMLDLPRKWIRPRRVFVNSMGDLFHEAVPDEFILAAFDVMVSCPQHQFQVLTKRSARLRAVAGYLPMADNIWLGVTVETDDCRRRLDDLRATPAKIKFVSFEPLLGQIVCPDLSDIDWAIVGGESGPKARPMERDWAISLRDACIAQGVAFFFKQWGGFNRKKAGRLLDGRTWDAMPKSDAGPCMATVSPRQTLCDSLRTVM